MATVQEIITGLRKYLDAEMISKMQGINRWIVGASMSMALDNGAEIFNRLKENQFVQSLQIISSDDEVDIDKIYKYLSEQAKKSAVTFTLPLVGAVTLKQSDIDRVYQYIMESI